MTVSYTHEVTTSTGFGCFLKLLRRWRGSIYKLIWLDLLAFLTLYYLLNFTYRFLLNESSRMTFEKVVTYCDKHGNLIPISFVLGFYVSIVMTRWWNQFKTIPFPDNLALLVSATIKGPDDRGRMIRRTIMRYICLTFAITLTMISPKVKKRFPTLDHYMEAGLLLQDEKTLIEDIEKEYPSYAKYWIPLVWASSIVTKARQEGLIRDDHSVKTILDELAKFRSSCGSMLDYDWISIPLVYTQVVTLAVYSYFLTALIGRQWIDTSEHIDLYFPFLTVLEFFFYVGWLRVAETLINPFGDDDDDFEVIWMIDRHVQVTYLIVDRLHESHPKLVKDLYWSTVPNQLPFTLASEQYMNEYPFPSTTNVVVSEAQAEIIPPDEQRRSNAKVDGKGVRRSKSWFNVFKKTRTSQQSTKRSSSQIEQHDSTVLNIFGQKETPNKTKERKLKSEADFDKLKKTRQALMKQQIINYLKLVKGSSKDD